MLIVINQIRADRSALARAVGSPSGTRVRLENPSTPHSGVAITGTSAFNALSNGRGLFSMNAGCTTTDACSNHLEPAGLTGKPFQNVFDSAACARVRILQSRPRTASRSSNAPLRAKLGPGKTIVFLGRPLSILSSCGSIDHLSRIALSG